MLVEFARRWLRVQSLRAPSAVTAGIFVAIVSYDKRSTKRYVRIAPQLESSYSAVWLLSYKAIKVVNTYQIEVNSAKTGQTSGAAEVGNTG